MREMGQSSSEVNRHGRDARNTTPRGYLARAKASEGDSKNGGRKELTVAWLTVGRDSMNEHSEN